MQKKATNASKIVRMTPVPVVVKRSYAGLGLVAGRAFRKGEKLLEYFGREISEREQYTSRSRYLFGIGDDRMVDGNIKENIARYINHACRPNCEPREVRGRIYIYARRAIKEGEELTYHYGKEYFDDYFKKKGCKCPTCQKKALTA